MYTGSIPVLASNKINDLRHPTFPSLPILKQPLKLSRFDLILFFPVPRNLSLLRKFLLSRRATIFLKHLGPVPVCAVPCARLGHFPFEGDEAFPA